MRGTKETLGDCFIILRLEAKTNRNSLTNLAKTRRTLQGILMQVGLFSLASCRTSSMLQLNCNLKGKIPKGQFQLKK